MVGTLGSTSTSAREGEEGKEVKEGKGEGQVEPVFTPGASQVSA